MQECLGRFLYKNDNVSIVLRRLFWILTIILYLLSFDIISNTSTYFSYLILIPAFGSLFLQLLIHNNLTEKKNENS